MSPRSGGEADKIGNRYESAWIVRQLLEILAGGAEALTVEPVGDIGRGIEFVVRRGDVTEVHQLKRQHGSANSWSVATLRNLGVWDAARQHIASRRHYHFVSMVPFRALQELTDRARQSNDLTTFIKEWLTNELNKLFAEIVALYADPVVAWEVMCGLYIRWPDELEVERGNSALAGLLLEGGSAAQASASLAQLAVHQMGVQLTADRLLENVRPYGLRRRVALSTSTLTDQVQRATDSWLDSVRRQLLEPVIGRDEAAELVQHVSSVGQRLLFVVGTAGGGKSGVLHQAVEDWRQRDVPVLSFRLDRVEPFSSTIELGSRLGIQVSPVTALAAVAGGQQAVLVVDQLDAVSLVSGRMPQNFDAIADVIREARAFPNMRIVLACRKFDVDNDHRIRELVFNPKSSIVTVTSLSDTQVDAAVGAMGLDAARLVPDQRVLLRLPLHLVLLDSIASEPNALDFHTTQHLFDAFWDRKRRDVMHRRPGTRYDSVVSALAESISMRQRLSVSVSVLDKDDLINDADVLISEHVLARDGREVAFFHEAFFDYAFARIWTSRGRTLCGFLTSGEQELFRRAQVRQIMRHMRGSDPDRFVEEVHAFLTSDEIRFHVKEAALAVLGDLSDVTSAEADMVISVVPSHSAFEAKLWGRLRTPAWFARFDADDYIASWLNAGEERQNRALNLMTGVTATSPDRVVELLLERRLAPAYPSWLRLIVRYAELQESRSLFDLFLDAIRAGLYANREHELWLSVHDLAEARPAWAVEVLVAVLVDQPGSMELDARGRVAALKTREHTATELVRHAAKEAPQQFCKALLPYLLRVMDATARERDEEGCVADAQFSHRYPDLGLNGDLDETLFACMASAIRMLVGENSEGMRPTLQLLASDRHESAQWLLYQGLIAGGATYADWAAELLLEGSHRLLCGYASNGVWTTRQVLQVISPTVSNELFSRLEAAVRDLRYPWEKRRPGWYAFNLLSGLEESRLSEVGRRRLGELRRSVGMEQPPEPKGVVGGWLGPPISGEAAPYMTDNNWLQAMAKHAGEREDFRSLEGGAREQSRVLQQETQKDPSRFARLAMRMTADNNPVYGEAVLMGLGEAEPVDDVVPVFDTVWHLAALGQDENDRWLGYALRRYLKQIPLDLVEMLRNRAVSAADPDDDGRRIWSEDGSRHRSADIWGSGINTARGSLAETLGDLLIYDTDGSRTALVAPVLNRLATDPAVPVRACVAHTIIAAMRYARPQAVEAFWRLIQTEDILLATEPVLRLIVYVGNDDPSAVVPVLKRMLSSSDTATQEAGGQLAAYAAMEWGITDRLQAVLDRQELPPRKGAAGLCAHRLTHTSNAAVVSAALRVLFEDSDEDVRKTAAEVAGSLREERLQPFREVVMALIASPAFEAGLPQLLITLKRAPDRVDDLVLLCAQRFVDVFGTDAGDIRTGAAGDARHVGELIVRGLAQSRTRRDRTALLNVLDKLLLVGAYGVSELVNASER